MADRGTGIPPADLERIFEPFVTTKAQGMGLGLAICRSIVEAHGGRLWATNNADLGATLHCELPAQQRADARWKSPQRPPSTWSTTTPTC